MDFTKSFVDLVTIILNHLKVARDRLVLHRKQGVIRRVIRGIVMLRSHFTQVPVKVFRLHGEEEAICI